jgi:adenine-specific DNA-methyltransferase
MSEERLNRLIEDFSYRNLNLFFRGKCENYAETTEELPQYDEEGKFSDFQKLGEIRFDDGDRLVVTTSQVIKDLSERSGKRDQYDRAKKILKELAVYDAGFFIFHDDTGSFRFSLVYGQAEGTRKSWSNFRRFTYFVSKDQTNNTFRIRVGGCTFANLEAVKDAFSVEKVTEDFYRQIADWYFWTVQNVTFPIDAEAEDNGRNIVVIRLITRLIFIWFMKERKLVSPHLFEKSTASGLLKSLEPNETTYYKAILQNLFFATLNTKKDERNFRFAGSFQGKNTDYMDHGIYRYEGHFKNREDMLSVFKDIPFLNGGLFDCLDWSAKESGTGREVRFDGFSDKEVGLSVPNYLFFSDEKEVDLNEDYGTKNKKYRVQGLFNILSAYNFTIDENDPNDQEVALDPELLGKVFEKLLASFNPETATTARRATGSYYTPREIVDYMVTQSLKQYYKTHLSDVADIENKLNELLKPVTGEPVNPFNEADSRRVAQLTEGLRIVDPAVGSGAFPMGILNKLVSVLSRVDPENRLWKEAQLNAVKDFPEPAQRHHFIEQINERFSRKSINYLRKLYLIQRCIYGVDIQQIAIEIAKLRFFIALLVHEDIDKSNPDNWGIEPLPNLDFKLMQGNSLISEFMGINLDSEESDAPARLMKDETDELISEYRNKKTDYQYEPDRKKKEALKAEIDGLIIRIFETKLQSQKADYYSSVQKIRHKYADLPQTPVYLNAMNQELKGIEKKYGFDIDKAETTLRQFTSGQKVKQFFAWKLYFAEVFREKNGFDVVIGNPPYIQLQKDNGQLADLYKDCGYDTYERTGDIYTLFYERGINILNTGGYLCYITSNKWMRAGYGKKLRHLLASQTLITVIDFCELPVFTSSTDPSIVLLSKTNPFETQQLLVAVIKSEDDLHRLHDALAERGALIEQSHLKTEGWTLEGNDGLELIDKIQNKGTLLKKIVNGRFYYGIKTGFNKAFILDELSRQRIIKEDARSAELIKPWLDGHDIRKWYPNFNKQYLIEIASSSNHKWPWSVLKSEGEAENSFAKTYPALYRHLTKFKTSLKKRADQGQYWWELRACSYWSEFDAPKIVFNETSKRLHAFIDYEKLRINKTGFVIVSDESEYLLGIINSQLMDYYYRVCFPSWGDPWKGGRIQFRKDRMMLLPIYLTTDPKKAQIRDCVRKILSTKRSDPKIDVSSLEHQIDQMVYELYGLTEEEKAVVRGSVK